jgi:nucleoside-diphosphate-sugar epimerase
LDWKNTRVLVTGAGGFIGSHLVDRLRALGADVTGFLRYNSRHDRGFFPDGCHEVRGDLCDFPTVEKAVSGKSVVFHLGALISVPYSFDHAEETTRVNVFGTANVLEAVKRHSCSSLVITSTSEVYGSAQYVPMDEKHPKNPQSPYAASKIAADALALAYHAVHGIPATVIRPFNTFGPRQSQRAVIPALISQILWRDKVKVGNLQPLRDFTFVSDTVAGLIAAAEQHIQCAGEEINLGTGYAFSIASILDILLKELGRDFSMVEVDQERLRSSGCEVTELRSNNNKAWSLLGWKPEISMIDGLRMTIDFVKAHPGMYDANSFRA